MNDLIIINLILTALSLCINAYETIISKFYICKSKCCDTSLIEIDVSNVTGNQQVIVIRKSSELQRSTINNNP